MEETRSPLDYWCPSVVDLIFQHFSIGELLKLTEVSSDFWSFVASYRKFRDNIAFKVNSSRHLGAKNFVIFLKSVKREYENLTVEGNESIESIEIILRHLKSNWKCVKISNMIFNGPTLLQNFIDGVQNNLEEFVMTSVFIFNCDKKILMSFPRLKRLEMVDCNDQENTPVKRISFVISDCKELKTLKFNYAGVSDDNQLKIFQENQTLKEVSLADLHDSFFYLLSAEVELKLEKLEINFLPETTRTWKPHLIAFLRKQEKFLKNLEVSGWINMDLVEVCYKMPKLKSLKLTKVKKFFMKLNDQELDQRLATSHSLRHLIIEDDLTDYHNIWFTFLNHAPNLTHFQMSNSFCSI